MIFLNRVFFFILLFLLLSLESIIALPIFSLFIFYKWLDRFNWKSENYYYLLLALLFAALLLALFYQLSLSLSLVLLLAYYFLRSNFGGQYFGKGRQQWQFLQLSFFALLQMLIFAFAGLEFNVFLILQILLGSILFLAKSTTIGRI